MSTVSKALPTPPDNFSTQIASSSIGTTTLSIQLDDASDLATEGVGQLFKKDANGDIIPGSIEFIHWTGKSTNTITLTDTGDRGIAGSDSGAQSYVADDYFEVWVSSYYDSTDAILVEHAADGTHDATKVVMIAGSQTITGAKTFSTAPLFTFGTEATGDTYYGAADGTVTRLAKGSDGQVLTLASGVPSWSSSGGSGPSFKANRGASNQAFSASTYVKVQHATEVFDTAGAYDNATNYRFTPLIAGKYLVIAQVRMTTLTAGKFCYSAVYKNGSVDSQNEFIAAGTGTQSVLCSTIVDMNGSTDYLEHFIWSDNGTTVISGDITETYFTATKI